MRSLFQIKKFVEETLDIENIESRSRYTDYLIARSVYYYLAKKHTLYSYSKISKVVGRNHATALHALQDKNLNFFLGQLKEEQYKKIEEFYIKKRKYLDNSDIITPQRFYYTNKSKYSKMNKFKFTNAYIKYLKTNE